MSLLPQPMKTVRISILLLLALCVFGAALTNLPVTAKVVEMHLKLRTRTHLFKNSSEWTAATVEKTIPARHTAIIICDMWDKHWCQGATTRVEDLARRMEPVLE